MKPIAATCLVLLITASDVAGVTAQTKKSVTSLGTEWESVSAHARVGTGNCAYGTARKVLHANNVMVHLRNTGLLFLNDEGDVPAYEVPVWTGRSPVFATALWVGGKVNGQLRTAAGAYAVNEFWPGPLGPGATPPSQDECSAYDRIWLVSEADLERYENTGVATKDLTEWPWHIGAPVIDGDGDRFNYNLAGGDRPEILGHTTAWWIMNDAGDEHVSSETLPIGLEVHVSAFALAGPAHVNNTTLYRYRLIYRGNDPLTDAYVGWWADPNLGEPDDDYVGTDTARGLVFTYNSVNHDGVYTVPPAIGNVVLQGPIVDERHLEMTSSMYYFEGGPAGTEHPRVGEEYYNGLQGRWRQGEPITAYGLGYRTAGAEGSYVFPGDPVEGRFWSEVNNDGSEHRNQPGERRILLSSGPFSMRPGQVHDVYFATVFAEGNDHLNSINVLRNYVDRLKEDFISGELEKYPLPAALPSPDVEPIPGTLAATIEQGDVSMVSFTLMNRGTGLSTWSVEEEEPDFEFSVVANANGILEQPTGGSADSVGFPVPMSPGTEQQANTNQIWFIGPTQVFGRYTYGHFLQSVARLSLAVPYDWEVRFTSAGGKAAFIYPGSVYGAVNPVLTDVPFELWRIGTNSSVASVHNTRYFPILTDFDDLSVVGSAQFNMLNNAGVHSSTFRQEFPFGIFSSDSDMSGASDDPFSDGISWLPPRDTTAKGERGYEDWLRFFQEDASRAALEASQFQAPFNLMSLIGWNLGETHLDPAPYAFTFPEVGTVFRIATDPPLARATSIRSGTLAPGTTVEISVLIDASKREVGMHRDTLWVLTRQPEEPRLAIPIRVEIRAGSTDHERLPGIAHEYALLQNYPNPFNQETTIHYRLGTLDHVQLIVYDIIGREISRLVDIEQYPGEYGAKWNAKSLPSGTYFCVLRSQGWSKVQPMILVR